MGKQTNNIMAKWGQFVKQKDGERVQKHITWTDEEKEYLHKIREENPEWSYRQLAEHLTHTYGTLFTWNGVRNRIRRDKAKKEEDKAVSGYKETVEILKDGSHVSDKLIKMSAENSKNESYLLKAHGYDDSWEIVSAKSSIWNQHNKQDGTLTLFASKITVKPKVNGVNWDSVIKKFESIKPKTITPQYINDIGYLNLPLFDMHFGISDYEYYRPTQERIAGLIGKGYKGVLFIIGQDMLHNDNFKGTTANGTVIDKVDMEKAWDDAMLFYIPLIELALEKCKEVKIMYSKGNHDESMSWAFVKALKFRFPQADIDTSFRERKAHMLGLNFIGVNHGDKKKEDKLIENFSTEFLFEWAKAKTREVFTGHLHTERVVDKGGVVHRRMPTGNKIDGYHDDYGYTTAHKRFEVLEYSEDAVKRIHYV